MKGLIESKILLTIPLMVTVYLVGFPAYAKYSGGTGELDDPYQIAKAEDLILLGESTEDYDKHFVLTADINLNPALPGQNVFDRAVISPDTGNTRYLFRGTPFTGVFDGQGFTISNLTIRGVEYLGLFGRLGYGAEISNLGLEDVYVTGTAGYVGGLVGLNFGSITTSYSTGSVTGREGGGLVGNNDGYLISCYSSGAVNGNDYVGGLVGLNGGTVINCYSTCIVSGTGENDGGLVGYSHGNVLYCVWDMDTSGLSGSAGGVGLTTAQMMDPYMLALNGFGNDPNWIIDIGRDYPRLVWEGTPGQAIPEPSIDWLDGIGTQKDPFQIEDAEQLLLLHTSSVLWDKHYLLNANIDLDPNLPGRSVFGQAVVPIFEGSFIGNGHVILNLQIEGGDTLGLFGKLSKGSVVRALGLENVSVYSTASNVGGLVGYNSGSYVIDCYSSGKVSGRDNVGGLVGKNQGFVSECYSTAIVSGDWDVGGLVGGGNPDRVTYCFWETQTSGQDASEGGTGLTTVEMQMARTFLEAGWDFMDETENGTEDMWWILEGQDYPRLRELPEGFRLEPLPVFAPEPQDGATEVTQPLILHWLPADPTLQHDIYFGEDKKTVVNATTESSGIYRGRQPAEITTFELDYLEWGKTYYWRIDEYNPDTAIGRGYVWSFTTADFLAVDDFESYNDLEESNRIWNTWIDGFDNPSNGSEIGESNPPFVGWSISHTGKESMPFYYKNSGPANYSEATANAANLMAGNDWTKHDIKTLSLWFRRFHKSDPWFGGRENDPEPMYVALANMNGPATMVYHDDPNAIQIAEWTEWRIDLQEFADQGVDLTNINTISIGFGYKDNPQRGGSGKMHFDDIRLYRLYSQEQTP